MQEVLSLEELGVGRADLLAGPVNRVDLLADESKEAELVRGAVLLRNVAVDERLVALELLERRRLVVGLRLGLLRLENRLGRSLEDRSLAALEFVGRRESSIEHVGEVAQVTAFVRPVRAGERWTHTEQARRA